MARRLWWVYLLGVYGLVAFALFLVRVMLLTGATRWVGGDPFLGEITLWILLVLVVYPLKGIWYRARYGEGTMVYRLESGREIAPTKDSQRVRQVLVSAFGLFLTVPVVLAFLS